MKVFYVNTVSGVGSTGRICDALCTALEAAGGQGRIAYGRGRASGQSAARATRISGRVGVLFDALLSRLSDRAGCFSRAATRRLIRKIEAFDPDVVHLHNLHGYYLNVGLLCRALAKRGRPVLITLHDCWLMTGHCCHFSRVGCSAYRTGCHDCPQRRAYPAAWWVSRAGDNWRDKKEALSRLPQLQLSVPSRWLAGVAAQSHLGAYPTVVIPNGVDTDVFCPPQKETVRALRDRYALQGKRVVLAAASAWSASKGLPLLTALRACLDEEYALVLVGLSPRSIARLPDGILGLPRTDSAAELAALYGMADVFVNASVEETMGMTTLEAMACGTPVVVSDQTAVPEVVDERSGLVVHEYTPAAFAAAIRQACARVWQPRESALRYGRESMCERYLAWYRAVCEAEKSGEYAYENS